MTPITEAQIDAAVEAHVAGSGRRTNCRWTPICWRPSARRRGSCWRLRPANLGCR